MTEETKESHQAEEQEKGRHQGEFETKGGDNATGGEQRGPHLYADFILFAVS